ncbi:60S ribosomal protein L6, mitochondrial [Glycine max]|nr:60S ribosomal protein L6, mitochondrial [Glycine max]
MCVQARVQRRKRAMRFVRRELHLSETCFEHFSNFSPIHSHRGNIFALELMEAKFFRFLKIVGVGYKARAEAAGRLLYLKLGYSHDVELAVPPAVRVFCFKNNVICCTGIDKQRVHQFAATVRTCKPPEVYKGKGLMYVDEVIKKKQGKKSK